MNRIDLSPVFGRGPYLAVSQRSSRWPLLLGFGAAIALGTMTFLTLSHARAARTAVVAPAPVAPSIARVARLPVAATLPAAVAAAATPSPMTPPADSPQHWRAPAMVVDLSDAAPATPPAAAATPQAAAPDQHLSADERFAVRLQTGNTAHAVQLRDMGRIAPQGTVIPAVLETAIDSDLPGSARAVVSRDVRSFDGTSVLIPRGSKLIGEYRSGVALGQSRAFVIWSRLLTPEGVSVDIASPAADTLGRGGLEGDTDSHFFQRFGSAMLLSVMSAGVNAAAEHSGGTAIVIGSSDQAGQLAGGALQRQIDIPVTVKVPQGTPLEVFVTRDLDFSATARR